MPPYRNQMGSVAYPPLGHRDQMTTNAGMGVTIIESYR
jgi:hypothetical protein